MVFNTARILRWYEAGSGDEVQRVVRRSGYFWLFPKENLSDLLENINQKEGR